MNTGARRASARLMFEHPAHLLALGFGSGLAPRAPGTVGTLWAWLTWWLLARWLGDGVSNGKSDGMSDAQWALLLAAALLVGVWACTVCARNLGVSDPGAIVWDEIVAFWLVLWLTMPMGLWGQLAAFALFRYFDAAKPGPVAWADQHFKPASGAPITWRAGLGIMLDDLVAAGCTVLVITLVITLWRILWN